MHDYVQLYMTCSFDVFVTKGVNTKDGELSGTLKFKAFWCASFVGLIMSNVSGFPARRHVIHIYIYIHIYIHIHVVIVFLICFSTEVSGDLWGVSPTY